MQRKRMKQLIFSLLICGYLHHSDALAYHIKFVQTAGDDYSCVILEQDSLPHYRGFQTADDKEISYKIQPSIINAEDPMHSSEDNIVEVFAKSERVANAFMDSLCLSTEFLPPVVTPRHLEIQKIVDGGDKLNRIDVVFMGDGYNASQRDQFYDDMKRLTKEMFEGVTFRSYLPLFNIWAIYVESVDTGIGYSGPKNTPFQLYREAGQLRGIFPGNAQYARQICALTGTSGCDYPSIIGNDDFYGGLGGEFVISTKSERTGTVVLRHEMGHNFVNVGEEYDNGGVYRGVNSASSVATLGWGAWLTAGKKEERAIYRLLEYPWADLSKGPQSFSFVSDGEYSRWNLVVSVSAAGEEDSLEFLLDGEVLPWKTNGFDDREFYLWSGEEGLSEGRHNFTVRTNTEPTHPTIPRMICSIRLHEYGSEEEYHFANDYVSAYPTWAVGGRKVFRPTNEGCLMRNMTYPRFCPVCQEGMWMQFLARVSLIDNVTVSEQSDTAGNRQVHVNTLRLGQLRAPGNEVDGESLEVTWFKENEEQASLNNLFTVSASPGNWKVRVQFKTPEIRHDPNRLTSSEETFVVPNQLLHYNGII